MEMLIFRMVCLMEGVFTVFCNYVQITNKTLGKWVINAN